MTDSEPHGFIEYLPTTKYSLNVRTDVSTILPWYLNNQKELKRKQQHLKTSKQKKKYDDQQKQLPVYLPLHDLSFLHQKPSTYNDLRQLPSPDLGALLYIIYQRYNNDQIYTALGQSVLISINPYKQIEELYSDDLHQIIRNGRTESNEDSQPHIFTIAERAYSNLLSTNKNQAILISGESGSGKTEATKRCLRYLVAESGSNSNIERRLLSANPILESFGNARTTRNHNSSRFGKWVEIRFGDNNLISGCVTTSYLLEKSRVVAYDQGESNYHVLHLLAKECFDDIRSRHSVAQHHRCRILYPDDQKGNQGYEMNPVHDTYISPKLKGEDGDKNGTKDAHAQFRQICQAMDMLDFSDIEIDMLWRILSIVLHLGNLVCVDIDNLAKTKNHQYECNSISENMEENYKSGRILHGSRAIISDQWDGYNSLQLAAYLMGISCNELHRTLLFKSFAAARRGRSSITAIPLKVAKANENCEALTKEIYSKLFSWIVQRINSASIGDTDIVDASSTTTSTNAVVGLLDIFGFEIFEHNSFEQFCINYANEKLHKHYLDIAFINELSIYKSEGIDIDTYGSMPHVSGVSALLDKKPNGLLWMLSEEMRIPGGA